MSEDADSRSFDTLSTPILVADTLKRSKDVWTLTDAAFFWCIITFKSIAFPMLVALAVMQNIWIVFGIGLLTGVVPFHYWVRSIARCERYEKEMRARTRELNRRNRTRL